MRVEGLWCRRGVEAAQEQISEGRRQGSRGKAIGRHPPGPFADAPTGTVGTTPGRCPGHHSGRVLLEGLHATQDRRPCLDRKSRH